MAGNKGQRPLFPLQALEKAGVPAGPINSVADVFADPQVIHRSMVENLPLEGRPFPAVRSPIMIDGQGMAGAILSPRLGQHTREVLEEMGIAADAGEGRA